MSEKLPFSRFVTVRRVVYAAAVIAAIGGGVGPAGAENGYWEPPGIHPSSTSLETVRAKVVSFAGALAQGRLERYDVTVNDMQFTAVATIRGDDYIVRSTLDAITVYRADAGAHTFDEATEVALSSDITLSVGRLFL